MNSTYDKKITIERHSILRDLLHNVWVIFLMCIVGWMGAFIVRQITYSPEYTSTATLAVSTGTVSPSSLSVSADVAEVFSSVLTQPAVREKAAAYLNKSSFGGTVSATVLTETNIIYASVSADNPVEAFRLMTAVLHVYPEITDEIFGTVAIRVIRKPTVPIKPSNAQVNLNQWLVAIVAGAVACAGIVLISVLRDTVKDEKGFLSSVDAPLLVSIPHERKKLSAKQHLQGKKKALLLDSSTGLSLRFSENYIKAAARLEFFNHTQGAKVFAVTSVAENEGKSTVASNIAIALAKKGNKVLLMDLDEKKPALYKIFNAGYKEEAELGSLLAGDIAPEKYLFRQYKRTGLLLALNTKPHEGYHRWIEQGYVARVIASLRKNVDFIIIDTAPMSADATVTDIVKIADRTVMVVRTDIVSVTSLNDALLTVTEVGGTVAGCVLNDVYDETSFFGQSGAGDEGSRYRYGHYYSEKHRYDYENRYTFVGEATAQRNEDEEVLH